MNQDQNQSTLSALGQGFVVTEKNANVGAVVSAAVNANPTTQVVQIGKPAQFATINPQDLIDKCDNVIEFNFHNGTGAAQIVYFSTLFGQIGTAASFNQPPSAVDFATFTETGSDAPANAGILKGFLLRAGFMGLIFGKIVIQTNDLAQSNQPLLIGYFTNVLTKLEKKCIPSLCDACYNNNDNAFTKEFVGPYAVSGANYIGYKVLDGKDVLVRCEILGEVQTQAFTALS